MLRMNLVCLSVALAYILGGVGNFEVKKTCHHMQSRAMNRAHIVRGHFPSPMATCADSTAWFMVRAQM